MTASKEQLTDLIARLERLSPDFRAIDADLCELFGPDVDYRHDAPYYTTDLQAALALVPEGGSVEANFSLDGPNHGAYVVVRALGWAGQAHAPRPARALCLAILKTRLTAIEMEERAR